MYEIISKLSVMSTKNKTILVISFMLLIAASFIVVSVLFLQDKKTFSELQEEKETESIDMLEDSSEKPEAEKKEVSEKELEPQEIIDKEIQVIIDDMKKQEVSFESELNYFE